MDERPVAPGSTSRSGGGDGPSDAAERLAAATHLLATLRAGRLRVEALAQQGLGFAGLVRVVGQSPSGDELVDEIQRTQDLVEQRLRLWRQLRPTAGPAPLASAPPPAAELAAAAALPPPEVQGWLPPPPPALVPPIEDELVAALEPATDESAPSPTAATLVPAEVDEPAAAAEESLFQEPADLLSVEHPPADLLADLQSLDLPLDDLHTEDLDVLADEPLHVPPDLFRAAPQPVEASLDAARSPGDSHLADEPSLELEDSASLLDEEFDAGDATAAEPTAADEPEDEPEEAPADGFSWFRPAATSAPDLDDEDDEVPAGVAAVRVGPPAAARPPLLDVPPPDEALPDEPLADEDEGEDHTEHERPGFEDEVDTINDFELDAALVHGRDEEPPASGTNLSRWFVEDEPAPQPDPVSLSDIEIEPESAEEEEHTHDESGGRPRVVPPQLVARTAAKPDPDEEATRYGVVLPPGALDAAPRKAPAPRLTPGNEGHTDELAAVPAGDDFLYDEDDGVGVSRRGGLSVAMERPRGRRRAEEESSEQIAAPRLTDDEPLDLAGAYSDSLIVAPLPEVDEARVKVFMDEARDKEKRGDLNGAIVAFGDAIDLAPDRVAAYLGRGRAHLELGDYSSAMSDFQRAEDIAPGTAEPLVEMGNLYFARKDYRRAIEFYDQALDIDGALAMARCRRGISHHYRRNHKAAFQDLQKAYSLDPDIPNIRKYVQMAVKAMERDRGRR